MKYFKYEVDRADGPCKVHSAEQPEGPYALLGEATMGEEPPWGLTWYDAVLQFCEDWCEKRGIFEFKLLDDVEWRGTWDHYQYADWSTSEGPRAPYWRINDPDDEECDFCQKHGSGACVACGGEGCST